MPVRPVVVIGIDAANPRLLRDWAGRGFLPNIQVLLTQGVLAQSTSLDGFYVGSTWPSLYTGVSPAKHGLHYLRQLEPGTYRFRRMKDAGLVARPPFWTALSAAGCRVAILDVPLSRLDSDINGIQVVEWGGHDAVFGFRSAPPGIAAEILQRFGSHPADSPCDAVRRGAEDYQRFVAGLEQGARLKGALTVDLMRQGPWDLLMQVFTESHCAGHQCWHLHDPSHPNHDPALRALTGDSLLRTYSAIDAAIGEILAAAGDATVVLVVAHGMSYRFGASFLLPDILALLGATASRPESVLLSRLGDLAASAWRRVVGSTPSPSKRLPAHLEKSRCFPVNNGLAAGGIRLNLKGREPHGVLAPGSEADSFAHELIGDLQDITDERTGRPLVRRVLRTADLYRGEHLGDLPDLLVEWSDEVPTGSGTVGSGAGALVRAHSAKLGTVQGINRYGRTGEHRAEGLLLAHGKGIGPGQLSESISILDFAPTIAALFGITLSDTDGRVVREMLPG